MRDENPHLVLGNVAIARKMGFPEVILPGDVRNDLYLTLISGEFSKGSKSTDKNVEVTVSGNFIILNIWRDMFMIFSTS